MKKVVYLHIGYFKTGTTAIQQFFGTYIEEMAKMGLIYPQTGRPDLPPAHHDLALKMLQESGQNIPLWFLLRKDTADFSSEKIWIKLVNEIHEAKADKVFISSEEFVRLGENVKTREDILKIKKYLRQFDVKIICYIRRQDDYYESWYNETVKGLEQRTIKECMEVFESIHFDYFKAIHPWEECFGRDNLIVRIFSKENLPKGIIADILKVLGVESTVGELSNLDKQINIRLNNKYVELKRWLNHFNMGNHRERMKINNKINELIRVVDTLMSSSNDREFRLLTYEERTELLKGNENINREISQRYFNGKWPLFPLIENEESSNPVAKTPNERDILHVILGLITNVFSKGPDFNAINRERDVLLNMLEMVTEIYSRDALKLEYEELSKKLTELKGSMSWKITKPLRLIYDFFK